MLNEEYATQIARDWNVKADGAGFVTRFRVSGEFMAAYTVQQRLAAGSTSNTGYQRRTWLRLTPRLSARSRLLPSSDRGRTRSGGFGQAGVETCHELPAAARLESRFASPTASVPVLRQPLRASL